VQTCGLNEGCLLYTWKKSSTESGKEIIFWSEIYKLDYKPIISEKKLVILHATSNNTLGSRNWAGLYIETPFP